MSGITAWVAGAVQPWADLYAASVPVEVAVAFLHFGGLLFAGGFALAFDRAALLRVDRGGAVSRRAYVEELAAVHRPVLLGLAVVTVSGLAMLLADVEYLFPSTLFWVKMGVFALLLGNGLVLRRTERRLLEDAEDEAGWRRLRGGAMASLGLWVAVLFLGVLVTLDA